MLYENKQFFFKMSWNTQEVETLLEQYQKYPCLYVTKHKDYHNKQMRGLAMQQIVTTLASLRQNITESEVQKKWNGLRNTYAAERKKVLSFHCSGAGQDDIYKPTLWYFDKMDFINDHLQIRDSKSNLNLLIQNSVALENIREEESISQQSEEYDLQEGELIYASSSSDERLNVRRNAQDEITPSKKIKRGKTNSKVEVFQLASNTLAKLSSAVGSTNERTDDDIYGEYVASRLKNITNKRAKLKLKNQIDQLLFQTEIEVVE